MNAFDTSGPSLIAAELEGDKKRSRTVTKAVNAKRATGVDPGRLWGLSPRWDERLSSDPQYNQMTQNKKTK
jgi:hypothetical protein